MAVAKQLDRMLEQLLLGCDTRSALGKQLFCSKAGQTFEHTFGRALWSSAHVHWLWEPTLTFVVAAAFSNGL